MGTLAWISTSLGNPALCHISRGHSPGFQPREEAETSLGETLQTPPQETASLVQAQTPCAYVRNVH